MSQKEKVAQAKSPRRALTTGQAAEYCFVTPDTIANWIKAGFLPAQRTLGGQYRIRVEDLRSFMASRDMCTARLDDALEEAHETRRPCWDSRETCQMAEASGTFCQDCIVRFLGALHCFKLMAMRPESERQDCSDCPYYRRWGETPEDLRWSVQRIQGPTGR